jgi:ferredoxin
VSYTITEDCITCGTCVDECPADAISEGDDTYHIDQEARTEYGTCAEVCPSDSVLEELVGIS